MATAWEIRAQSSRDYAVSLTATTSSNPPSITITWDASESSTSFRLYRRVVGETAWGDRRDLPAAAGSFRDEAVSPGLTYEYRAVRRVSVGGNSFNAFGYISTGIQLPFEEVRGSVLVLLEHSLSEPLRIELDRLKDDLEGDGWNVIRREVDAALPPPSVRAIVRDTRTARSDLRAVFIIGHVAVPYSGNINPDGHADHLGAWPADAYYGDLDGVWTDTATYELSTGRNRNVTGDGRFDQSVLPSDVELQVGRVDFSNMPALGASETELTRRYLDKDHAYRHGNMKVERKALIDDNFGAIDGESFGSIGWRTFPSFVGFDGMREGDWRTTFAESTYLFAFGCGPGTYESAAGVGGTEGIAATSGGAIFTMLFGSYFGDWDAENSLLKAPLANGATLASCWAGRPTWHLYSMATGSTVGHATRVTQNNDEQYITRYGRSVHIALLGDPTLRVDVVPPPSSAAATPQTSGGTLITWVPSAAVVLGYIVLRSEAPGEPFVRVGADLVQGTSFRDERSASVETRYMVRAVAADPAPGASRLSLSQGVLTVAAEPGAAPELASTTPARVRVMEDRVVIDAVDAQQLIDVRTFDIRGREVALLTRNGSPVQTVTWPTADVPNGIYLLRIRTAEGIQVAPCVVAR